MNITLRDLVKSLRGHFKQKAYATCEVTSKVVNFFDEVLVTRYGNMNLSFDGWPSVGDAVARLQRFIRENVSKDLKDYYRIAVAYLNNNVQTLFTGLTNRLSMAT